MKNILALDLGSKTGFAFECQHGISVGTWELVSQKNLKHARAMRLDRRLDPRIPALWFRITSLHAATPLDWLVWEDVQFSSSTAQTQLWSSFRTVCWLFGHVHSVGLECVPVGTLKKFATGSGNADKAAMAKFLRPQPGLDMTKLDDNAVDALHLLRWAKQLFK